MLVGFERVIDWDMVAGDEMLARPRPFDPVEVLSNGS